MKTSILISKIRRGMSLPNVENRFSDLTILDLANDELQSSILPWLFALREDFLVASETYALNCEVYCVLCYRGTCVLWLIY
jgi:hypothetical protein